MVMVDALPFLFTQPCFIEELMKWSCLNRGRDQKTSNLHYIQNSGNKPFFEQRTVFICSVIDLFCKFQEPLTLSGSLVSTFDDKKSPFFTEVPWSMWITYILISIFYLGDWSN